MAFCIELIPSGDVFDKTDGTTSLLALLLLSLDVPKIKFLLDPEATSATLSSNVLPRDFLVGAGTDIDEEDDDELG